MPFSEARLKAFSGGEKVSARRLHKEFFDFQPQGKIVLSFNRTPQIKADDDGIWRRLHIVPFPVQIPPGQRRPMGDLLAEFREEAAGILNWMLEGWRAYRVEGLEPPPEVAHASTEIRESMDTLGQFLSDCCETGEREQVCFKILYAAARGWYEAQGMRPPTSKALGQQLSERGYRRGKAGPNRDRAYMGLRMKRTDEDRPAEMARWLEEAGIGEIDAS